MDKKRDISMAVIKRLPKYYRHLAELLRNDVDRISSKELSDKIGFTASQIRQDFNCFGGFGQQGYGYNVKELYSEIGKILGIDKEYATIIVGAGNIGQAIANYSRFDKMGFNLKGIFDTNPKMIGMRIKDIEIDDVDNIESFLKKNTIDIGIICVPSNHAQKIAEILIANNIKGLWNFAPIDLDVPPGVSVENVHLSESILTLVYLMNEAKNESKS